VAWLKSKPLISLGGPLGQSGAATKVNLERQPKVDPMIHSAMPPAIK
jgi:hypothetical protein